MPDLRSGPVVLCVCPTCAAIVASCDEHFDMFPDPRALRADESLPTQSGSCPTCAASRLRDFRLATDEELAAAGFRGGDYVGG